MTVLRGERLQTHVILIEVEGKKKRYDDLRSFQKGWKEEKEKYSRNEDACFQGW
jgi:hypothetical protein